MTSSWTKIQIGLIIILILAFTRGIGFYTDYLWFQSMGYSGVFITILRSKIIIGLLGAAIFFLFAFINAYIASISYAYSRTKDNETEIILPENLNTIIIAALAAVSLGFGTIAAGSWETVLLYLNRASFGITDPIFKMDAGFYIFELPFYESALRAAFFILAATVVLITFVYLLKSKSILFDMTFSDIKFEVPKFTSWAKGHLYILLALFFITLGLNYRLEAYNLLFSSRSAAFFGPGYTDLTAALPVLRILLLFSIITAGSLLLNIWLKRPIIPAILVIALFAVHIAGLGFYAGIVQEYRVRPNEIKLETPYIENNIRYTISAFGLEKVTNRTFIVETNLTQADLRENSATIENIRLWDPRPLKDTYSQLQGIRLYYEFNDVDVDRYEIDGDYVELMLSAREINPKGLPPNAQNWINEHLVYTHGYGIVASPVNRITTKRLPELFVKDIPPVTKTHRIDRPEIYFGEITNTYVIVNTGTEEFDYPMGDENKYTFYEAESGVLLDSYLRKLVMSIRFGTPKIILSKEITPQSRILFNRNIRQITQTIAPFLSYDKDPYIVASDGRLYWIQDAYTTSEKYPYSTPYFNINYIRNPVKVVIDAYNGQTTFYIIDDSDPIIQAYAKTFPDLFRPYIEMPDDLKSHIRYPEDMFTIQAEVYAKYHMNEPRVFYNLEDMWNIPNELYEGRKIRMVPYYIIMKLPGEEKEEFLLMQPFTPRNKDNMISWMYARSDPGHYGKLGVFKFPKQELIFGPMQIEARIDQDSRISEQLTLWGQVGSRVIRGNLLVIPIEGSILYVEPLYLIAEQSQLPQLERVIIAYGDEIVMEEDLERALSTIFGAPSIPPARPSEPTAEEDGLASLALKQYDQALLELKNGNWTGFGDAIKALEETLIAIKNKGINSS